MTQDRPPRGRRPGSGRSANPSGRRPRVATAPRAAELADWKFEAPRLPPQLFARDALAQRMEHHLSAARPRGGVVLVSAPSGYGKTTLIASWAAQTPMRVVWYSLDRSDNDPVTFTRGLLRALGTALPRTNWRVTEILDHLPQGAAEPSEQERITLALIDDLRRLLANPVALVLLELSEISAGQGAHAVLSDLLAQQPDNLRLVLESRTVPRLDLAALSADHRLHTIAQDELSLRPEGIAALLALHGVTLNPQQTERLHGLSAGCVTGVLLGTDPAAPQVLERADPTAGNDAAAVESLAAQLVGALPADLRDFAMQASVLETFTSQLVDDVLQIEDARERLSELERHPGFLTRVGNDVTDPVYRMQPLLRQALLAALRRERGAERRRELHERAGHALEAAGRDEQAVQHYAHARRFDRILAIIDTRRGALLRSGRGALLAQWVAALPADVREANPRLHVLLAELYRHTGRTTRAWQALRLARLRTAGEPELAARALVVRAKLRVAQSEYGRARRDSERALSLSPPEADDIRAQAAFVLAGCLLAAGESEAASACLDQIEGGAQQRRDLWVLARLSYYRSIAAMRAARYREAEAAAEQALRFAQEAHADVDAVNSRLNLAILHACNGDFGAARADLEAAGDQARRAGYALGRLYVLLNRGDVERLQGDYDAAIALYQKALDAAERLGDSDARDCAMSWLGLTLALSGQAQAAIELLGPLAGNASSQSTFLDNLLLALGIAYFKASEYERAVDILRQARDRAAAAHSTIRVAQADVFLAASNLGLERLGEARAALQAALEAVSLDDAVAVLMPNVRLAPDLRPLLEWTNDPRARALKRAFHDQRSEPVELSRRSRADEAGNPTGAIRVYTLGGSRVFNGNDLTEHWRLPAARELLCFMLDQQQPASKGTLLTAIWPDKPDDLANLNFRQAVFQLKRVLGRPCLKKVQGRWQLAVDCWVDTREFERLAEEGERLAQAGALDEAAAALRQALTYYAGDYLVDVSNTWAQTRREQLHRRQLAILERLAGLDEQRGRDEEAAGHYYELLEEPEMRECACRGLMRYYARRGEYGRVREQYDRLARDLGAEISPESETRELYERLTVQAWERS